MRFLRLLDQSGRLALHPLSALRPGFGAGAFAIPKSSQADRLILDCRPANCLEEDEDRWVRSLGSVFQLRTLFLKSGFKLITFAEDIRDFYYGFTVPEQRQQRNFFDCPLPGSAFLGFDCYRPELADQVVCPCLATMAMGDKRAVAAGQAAHLSVALRSGSFELGEFVTLKAGVPRAGDFSGLMIDDFIHCAQVPVADDGGPATSSPQRKHAEAKMDSAYAEAHLPRHEGKSVRGADNAEVWGAELLGEVGIARPNFKRVIPVAGLLSRLLAVGHSTVRLLEVVAGALVSAFQFRRRLMCLLSEIYAAQSGRHPADIVRLSPELFQELLIAAVLLPLARIDLRAPCLRGLPSDRVRLRGVLQAYAAQRGLVQAAAAFACLSPSSWSAALRPRAAGRALFLAPYLGGSLRQRPVQHPYRC